MLGRMYYIGHGVPQDYGETLRWYRRAVERDDPRAQFYLGLMYYNGNGVPQDDSEAVKWIRRAAEQGDAEAQFEVGGMYSVGAGVPQDYTETARWYRRAAEQGYADAQFVLWLYYHEGRGVRKDPVEAARWLRLAAEQGHADAQFKLGTLYIEGVSVPENVSEAVKWLRRAAEQGHAETLEMFGDTLDVLAEPDARLEDGGGGDVRFAQLLGAAEGGDAEAEYELAVAYAEGRGDVDDDDRIEQSLRWLTRAANQGHAGAMAELGSFYQGTDDVVALRWLRPAAEQDHGGAQTALGHMYAEGQGVPKDDAEAARLFRLAAEQGFAQAQYNFGLMYFGGRGVRKDNAETARWFRLAAEQGHPDAQAMLGVLYSTGNGVPRDDSEAEYWLRLAADQGQADAQAILGNGDELKHRQRTVETWRCFDNADFNRNHVLFTLIRLESGGEVSVAGMTHSAGFEVRGLDRRWDFGPDGDGGYDYAVVIQSDGTGLYYDFSRSTDGRGKPSQFFECEKGVEEGEGLLYAPTSGSRSECDIDSRVDGEFEGWKGDTVVRLMNGQIWEQTEYHYEYSYQYMPGVTIFRSGGQCKMLVDGVDEPVGVVRVK